MGRSTRSADMPRRAIVVRWAVGLGGILLLFGMLLFRTPFSLAYLGLFLVSSVLADAFFRVRVAPGAYFSFSPTFTVVFFLIAGGVAAGLLEALAGVLAWTVGQFRGRRIQTPLYGLFDVGKRILSALGGAAAVSLLFGRSAFLLPVLDMHAYRTGATFAAGYLLADLALSSIAVGTRSGAQELKAPGWRTIAVWSIVSMAASAAFAIILWQLQLQVALTAAVAFVFLVMAGAATMLRLNVGLRTGNEELKTINRIGQLLSSTLDIPQIFRILARETRAVLPWDGFFIATAQNGSDQIQIIFMTSEGDEIAQRIIPRGAGLTGRAMESGEPVVYDRAGDEKSISVEDTIRGRRRPRSILVAPMMFGRQALGAISVQSFQAEAYARQHVQLLQTLASQTAIALRNAQLLRSEQKAIAERDEFLSLTTHEIKNPLTSVRGYLEIAREAIRGSKNDEALDALDVVHEEAMKIQRFAEDLLEVSRIGGGKFSIHLETADFSEIIRRVVNRYADTSDREIVLRISDRIPPIEGDPTRLGQVVENLVSNAVKYSSAGTRIDIELESDEEWVRLRVRDQGVGIPEAQISLIFERFYRVEEAGQTIKGTGLGLFITREIIRMHGGAIRAESSPGDGSVFIVELPVRR